MRDEQVQADWVSVELSLLSRTVASISIVIAGAQARAYACTYPACNAKRSDSVRQSNFTWMG